MKTEMLYSMLKEIKLRKNELKDKTLKSLYFGGGTPSILTVDEIKLFLEEVQKYYTFSPDIEITLEANPDDLDQFFLKQLSDTEINRLSIGTQSFFDEDLKLMNRSHSAKDAEYSIKQAQDFGFKNLNIDLIYGSPTSNFEIWQKNLQKVIELKIPHISSYALTVEPKTALSSWVANNKILPPEEEHQNRDFYFMKTFLKENGFQHYEISNFALPDFHSRHNSAYWKYQPYLGIGPSAHSYDGIDERSWNISNNQLYINNIKENKLPIEREKLSDKDRFNEMIMIGLRTIFGVDLSAIKRDFSIEIQSHLKQVSQEKLQSSILVIEDNHLKISENHWFMADGIASDLFII